MKEYKKKLQISQFLDAETTSDDAEEAKPSPDIFQAAFRKLKNVKKEEVLIIGDTPYDAEAAVKAGLKIIGVKTGGWSENTLIKKGCFVVYEDLTDILDNFKGLFS